MVYPEKVVPLHVLITKGMPRQTRKKSGTGIYHVMLRGINRQDIFEEEEDYLHFLRSMDGVIDCKDERGEAIPSLGHFYAYCLMPNHVHLLIQERTATIGEIVKRIAVSYAYYFNKKYFRNGHLFQDRFKSEPVDDMAYFKTLIRYIHQNPVHAGICRFENDYKWSSWHEYMKDKTVTVPVCSILPVLRRIDWAELIDFVNDPSDDHSPILEIEDEEPRHFLSDEEIRTLPRCDFGIIGSSDSQKLNKQERNEMIKSLCSKGAGARQLSRITGISYGIIQRVKEL